MENLIYNETPTSFPWYDSLKKQNRFKENVLDGCDFKLIAPKDTLLPFQFRKPKLPELPLSWKLYRRDNSDVIDLSNNLNLIRGKTLQGMDYIYFCGEPLAFLRYTSAQDYVSEPLNLPMGYYYSVLEFPSGSFYSEVFWVSSKSFSFSDYDNVPYLRMECYNKSDMEPFYYNDKVDGIPRYKNTLFIDTFTFASLIEITEEGEKDGNGVVIPDFQMASIKYNLSLIVPDYLKLYLVLLQMHSGVFLTEKYNVRSGQLKRITTNSDLEANGSLSTVDITYEQDLAITKAGCNNNMLEDPISTDELILTSITNRPGAVLRFIGEAPEDGILQVWGSNIEAGVYTNLAGNYTAANFASGIDINANLYMGKQWFYVRGFNWNYDYGHTDPQQKPV